MAQRFNKWFPEPEPDRSLCGRMDAEEKGARGLVGEIVAHDVDAVLRSDVPLRAPQLHRDAAVVGRKVLEEVEEHDGSSAGEPERAAPAQAFVRDCGKRKEQEGGGVGDCSASARDQHVQRGAEITPVRRQCRIGECQHC